ncbi:uncharacterized protein FFB20_12773 [Fusarium fujikuroi]|nr:uncharacterized protein FFE2_06911 [Fusarium fujikuroi]SCN98812.1 uncharacterized protein FFM5_06979 [Fusarium fujikuroi]SCO07124.1 uncharacterized protein FFB20_12773 [Fusarium fujikuroi]SCO18896.1 uncharacterized protein FFC1_13367 [Fusarium fujikuroi]SCO38628.1 uncharacterized protein FFMR_05245 [Fusarium fujikuroi]
MGSNRKILNTLRYTLGLSNLQDVSQLAQVSQNLLEQKFDATPESFSARRMGKIYMTWLIHQDFTTEVNLQSQVVEQWVSFVNSWGFEVEDAIALWAKINNKDTESDEDTKQLREKRNALRHEIENQFLNNSTSEPIPPSGLVQTVPPLRNYNTRGQIRKFDEYTKSALQDWPTRDIPFSSIETAADTDTKSKESEESEEITSLDIKGEHGEVPAKKKAKLDTGGSSSLRLVSKGSGTGSSPIDLTK